MQDDDTEQPLDGGAPALTGQEATPSAPAHIMNLPARTEGPHSWMWRLIEADADHRMTWGAQVQKGEILSWIWQGIATGCLWIAHDRSTLLFDRADPWLQQLVGAEVERHLALSAELDATLPEEDPRRLLKSQRPPEQRREAIQGHLWRYLSSGWARIDEAEDRMLFWEPFAMVFVPYTAELNLTYARLFRDLVDINRSARSRLADLRPYTGPEPDEVPESADAYVGPAVPLPPQASDDDAD